MVWPGSAIKIAATSLPRNVALFSFTDILSIFSFMYGLKKPQTLSALEAVVL